MSAPWELRDPEAPSELVLDAWAAGEATAEEIAAVEAWAGDDPTRRAVLETRRQGFAALPAAPERMLAHIRRGSAEAPSPWWRRWQIWIPLAATAAVAAALLIALRPTPTPPETVIAKGTVTLRVFREKATGAEEALSGADFAAGDRLRFVAQGGPADGHLMVVGVEQDGDLFAYPPADAGSIPAARLDADGALPGAAILDASAGRELAHLVWCVRPFALADLGPVDGDRLTVPAGCRSTGFVLNKR